MWWSGALVVAFGLVAFGWRAHLWYCQRRNGCPIWRQLDTGEWVNRLTSAGWLTKNGKRHFPREERERHPTTEVATPQILDEQRRAGVPSRLDDTPTTDLTNAKRRTP